MDGGCQVPIAGYATVDGDDITMTGLVASPDGAICYKETIKEKIQYEIGKNLLKILTDQGAYDLIAKVKAENNAINLWKEKL